MTRERHCKLIVFSKRTELRIEAMASSPRASEPGGSTVLASFPSILRTPSTRRPLQFIIDRKFFDARAVLGARGWTSKSDNVRSKFCDFKWSNSKNVDTQNPLPTQILNHLDGTSQLALKSAFSWRVRAAELCFKHDPAFAAATFPAAAAGAAAEGGAAAGDAVAEYTPWYPLCYNLDYPSDAYCFVVSAALLMARAVLAASAAAERGDDASDAVVSAAAALCAACGEKQSFELLGVAAPTVAALLHHGDSAGALLASAGLAPAPSGATPPSDRGDWKSVNEARGLWIVKPGNLARGEGIFLTDALRSVWTGGDAPAAPAAELSTSADAVPAEDAAPVSLAAAFARRKRTASKKASTSARKSSSYDPVVKSNLVVQQYIERPLLIRRKKFDMRQWVLVSSVNPLEVWFLDECYLRFCSVDYALRERGAAPSAEERYIHLSNNSVQKHCPQYKSDELAEVLEGYKGLMWPSGKFERFLAEEHPLRDPLAWARIQERMAAVATAVVTSAAPMITPRVGSFELLGFDFMLDEDLKVWLLEVNSSPDCSHATPVLTRICDHAHRHLFDLMMGRCDAKGAVMSDDVGAAASDAPPTLPAADAAEEEPEPATPYDFVAEAQAKAAAKAVEVEAGDLSGPRWRLVHKALKPIEADEVKRRKAALGREWFDSEWKRRCGGGDESGDAIEAKLETVIAELFPEIAIAAAAAAVAPVLAASEPAAAPVLPPPASATATAGSDSSDEEL